MSLEEMRRLLLTSAVTGLPNRRAFEEAGSAPAVAMSDLDGLKAINTYGYAVGDAVLRAKADAILEEQLSLQLKHERKAAFGNLGIDTCIPTQSDMSCGHIGCIGISRQHEGPWDGTQHLRHNKGIELRLP